MPHICKRNKIYYVFWYEQGKHHCKAISPSIKEAEQWSANLTLRLYSKKNGMSIRYYPFKDFIKEYINEYVKYKAIRTQTRDLETISLLLKLFPKIEYVKDYNDLTLKLMSVNTCLRTFNAVSRWLQGTQNPSQENFEKMSKIFRRSEKELEKIFVSNSNIAGRDITITHNLQQKEIELLKKEIELLKKENQLLKGKKK